MFDITIEQSVLAKALEYLEPTVGKGNSNLGENCISMMTTGNGSIKMYTTNSVEFTELEAIVSFGGNTQEQAPYVDFKRFAAIIKSIPANEVVSIKANVNDLMINFALKKTPIRLVGDSNGMIPLPTNQFPSTGAMTIPKQLLGDALNNVCTIITDSVATPIYNCMRIFTDQTNVEITALDMTGKRTFVQSGLATGMNPTADILIEASKLKKSFKIFEDYTEIEMVMDNNMIRIRGDVPVNNYSQKSKGMITDIIYYARRLNGSYPTNIKSTFNPLPTEFSEISKEELLNSLSRVKALEDSSTGGNIGFEVNGGTAVITTTSSYGNLEDSIATENTISSSFKTTFKYASLSDIMKVINTNSFEIGVLPNHPSNYVIKAKGNVDVMFTIPGIVSNATP